MRFTRYIMATLIKLSQFSSEPIDIALNNIAKCIRGVSQPLSACYLGVFIAKEGYSIDPNIKEYLFTILEVLMKHISEAVANPLPGLIPDTYFKLFEFPIDWVCYCLCSNIDYFNFEKILAQYKEKSKSCGLVLEKIISNSPSSIVVSKGEEVLELIKEQTGDIELRCLLAFANLLNKTPFPNKKKRLDFINYAWAKSKLSKNGHLYMEASIALTEFAINYLKVERVELLHEIFQKFKSFISPKADDQATNKLLFQSLEKLLLRVISTSTALTEMLSIDTLIPLFDYFSETAKKKLCELMLESFIRKNDKVSDLMNIHTLFGIARVLHDSIDLLSVKEEQSRVELLLNKLVSIIDFGVDHEQQLKVITEARSLFFNFESITYSLIEGALRCSYQMYAETILKGHTRKSMAFVKSCISFIHITIPSLSDVTKQLHLYIKSSEMALINNLISEADAMICQAIQILSNFLYLPEMLQVAGKIMNLVIIIPGNPQISGFNIAEKIIDVMTNNQWNDSTYVLKIKYLCKCLDMINTMLQGTYPHTVHRVDSNDKIFVGDQQYKEKGAQIFDKIIDEMMEAYTQIENTYKDSREDVICNSISKVCYGVASTLLRCCQSNQKTSKIIQKFIGFGIKYMEKCKVKSGLLRMKEQTIAYFNRKAPAQ